MGTRKNRLGEAVLTSTHNLCFGQKYEKYQGFMSENFQFLEVKFSIYLNRRVFLMECVFRLAWPISFIYQGFSKQRFVGNIAMFKLAFQCWLLFNNSFFFFFQIEHRNKEKLFSSFI